MKSILFQLAYQAASTVLLLIYANKYQLEQQQHDQERKQLATKNGLARAESDRGSDATNSSYNT